jgi:hypothetical protein
MNWSFLQNVDDIAFKLECALDNLGSVHTAMVDEEGSSWERSCNAIFSTYLQLSNIHAELTRCVDQAVTEERKSRGTE